MAYYRIKDTWDDINLDTKSDSYFTRKILYEKVTFGKEIIDVCQPP